MKFRPPRRGAFVFLIFISSVVTLLIYRSRLLFGLLLENGSSDAVDTPAILHDFSSLDVSQQPQLIPKIIHQIWINDSIPAQWQEGTKAVKHHHEGWEYMVGSAFIPRNHITNRHPRSSGPINERTYSWKRPTRNTSRSTNPTLMRSNALTLCAISFSTTTAAFTSTSMSSPSAH